MYPGISVLLEIYNILIAYILFKDFFCNVYCVIVLWILHVQGVRVNTLWIHLINIQMLKMIFPFPYSMLQVHSLQLYILVSNCFCNEAYPRHYYSTANHRCAHIYEISCKFYHFRTLCGRTTLLTLLTASCKSVWIYVDYFKKNLNAFALRLKH